MLRQLLPFALTALAAIPQQVEARCLDPQEDLRRATSPAAVDVAFCPTCLPEVSVEASNPKRYVIINYRGNQNANSPGNNVGAESMTFLSVDTSNDNLANSATLDINSIWYFTVGSVDGSVIFHNVGMDGRGIYIPVGESGTPATLSPIGEDNDVYILSNGVNNCGLSISGLSSVKDRSCLDGRLPSQSVIYSVGAWQPLLNDWMGTTWAFVAVDDDDNLSSFDTLKDKCGNAYTLMHDLGREEVKVPEATPGWDVTNGLVSFKKPERHLFNEWMNIYLNNGDFYSYPVTENKRIRLNADANGEASSFDIVDAQGNGVARNLSVSNLMRIDFENRLPDIYITTDDGIFDISDKTTVHPGKISIEAHGDLSFSEFTDKDLKGIRGRGNSTLGFMKKPYRIQFDKKTEIHKDLKKSKNYVLLANYKDGTLMRNTIASWIGQALDVPYTTHMIPVNVWLNGSFKGSYTLCEKTGMNSGHISDIDETQGILLELDTNYDPSDADLYMRDENGSTKFGPLGFEVCIKDPDFAELIKDGDLKETTVEEQHARWTQKFLALENALAGISGEDWTDLLDLESVVKYVMVFNLTANQELKHPKSVFMHAHSYDDKFIMGHLWDFDWAYNGGDIPSPQGYFFDDNILYEYDPKYRCRGIDLFMPIMSDSRFQEKYAEIWNEFKTHLPDLYEYMGEYAGLIESSAAENAISEWGQSTRPGSFRQHVEELRSWIEQRADFISTAPNFGLFPETYQAITK
ncbi:MAG: CotH kinase family protein [Alloprevotella sp.]|nr:CotH kinase family protein [Alloprevotella sp.]